MVWQPSHLTREQMEERRLAAARLLRAKRLSQAEIARELGVSRATVTRWKHQLEDKGIRGLRRRRSSGRPPSLTKAQWRQLVHILRRGSRAAGFETEQWTRRRIALVIKREFGVSYHPFSVSRALRQRGWSPQLPIPRAKERDETLIKAWLTHDWPRIKRGLAKAGESSSSGTKQGTPFGPVSEPPGRPSLTRRS
jgi:transposase